MSSAGHILDMIKRLRQNKSMRPSNRQKFQGDNRETIYAGVDDNSRANFKEFSEEEVQSAIKLIREKAKARKRREYIFFFSCLIATAGLFYALFSSDSYVEYDYGNSAGYKTVEDRTIHWSGNRSEPLSIPNSDLFYIPVVRELENEIMLNGTYKIEPPEMVGDHVTNIVFFDKDCAEIATLLKQNGSISSMWYKEFKSIQEDSIMPRIIYGIAQEDSNDDGIINRYDRHYLYISEINGSSLKRITDKNVSSMELPKLGQAIYLTFPSSEATKDSLYGCFDIKTGELYISTEPNISD